MALEVGMILEGKVSGITKFGAFVDLPDSKTGMVHISEVAPTYISEISDYVKYLQTYGLWLLGGIVFSTPGPRMLYDFLRKKVPIAVVPILLTIFWVSVYWMVKGQSDPFMYFHF